MRLFKRKKKKIRRHMTDKRRLELYAMIQRAVPIGQHWGEIIKEESDPIRAARITRHLQRLYRFQLRCAAEARR